jgi:carbon-monoxide dehydrogenase medium subunit
MQVPSHVEYERATSVEHALDLLARFGPESRVLAGGHSLIPMMKLRLAQPETLVDINAIPGLSRITVEGDELRIGALVRHAQLLASAVAGEHFPVLHDAERVIADPIVRNWGTIGGSLCQADPSEDLSAAFGALRAMAVIQGQDGVRTVPVRAFHLGPYETVVTSGELLTELRVPLTRRSRGVSVTGPSPRPGPSSGWTRPPAPPRWPGPGSAWPRSGPVISWPPRPRTSSGVGRPTTPRSPGPGRSPRSTAARPLTSAGPSTTSGTSPGN